MLLVSSLLLSALVPDPQVAAPDFVRGTYGRDSSADGVKIIKNTGFNTVTAMPYKSELDVLASRGLKAIVWLGDYNRVKPCDFEWNNDQVADYLREIKGHPAILAYQVSDEPDWAVPTCGVGEAVSDTQARANLIKSIDSSKPTYVVISAWDGKEGFPYEYFKDATDIIGISVYPCSYWKDWVGNPATGCAFDTIDRAIDEADKDGVRRYWGILQLFADSWFRMPTPDEVREQFDRWDRSRMEGYLTYHWNNPDGIGGGAEHDPELLSLLREMNARQF